PQALVRLGQLPAAVAGRSADPTEASVELGRPPLLGLGQLLTLTRAGLLGEERPLVGALAPDEGLLLLAPRRMSVEEGPSFLLEHLEAVVGHGWTPLCGALRTAPPADRRDLTCGSM